MEDIFTVLHQLLDDVLGTVRPNDALLPENNFVLQSSYVACGHHLKLEGTLTRGHHDLSISPPLPNIFADLCLSCCVFYFSKEINFNLGADVFS